MNDAGTIEAAAADPVAETNRNRAFEYVSQLTEKPLGHFIDGQPTDGANGEPFDVLDPSTGEEVDLLPTLGAFVTPNVPDILRVLRDADEIVLEELVAANLYRKTAQVFAVLLPIGTVGVMGDHRTYDSVCALRAVTSVDGMTADIYPFDAAFLSRCATRIINEVKGINRCTYDITSKPPGTIEWE